MDIDYKPTPFLSFRKSNALAFFRIFEAYIFSGYSNTQYIDVCEELCDINKPWYMVLDQMKILPKIRCINQKFIFNIDVSSLLSLMDAMLLSEYEYVC